jgi:hypothetical protein
MLALFPVHGVWMLCVASWELLLSLADVLEFRVEVPPSFPMDPAMTILPTVLPNTKKDVKDIVHVVAKFGIFGNPKRMVAHGDPPYVICYY